MKKIAIGMMLLCMAALSFAQKAGDKVSFVSKDLKGAEVTSELFSKNKITMVNIWGTFCPPCIREMPDLAKLNQSNKDKGVEVVGIVIDLTDRNGSVLPAIKKDADKIVEQTGADYTHIVPTKDMLNGLLRNIQVVPSTIFVGSDGKIIGQMYLGARSQKDWQKVIDSYLEK